MGAKKVLAEQGIDVRVVSMPCIEVFNKQPKKYRESVIPSKVRARVCVEAATPYSWHQFAGLDGEIIAMNTFGESAPAELLFEHFGFTVENVVAKALKTLKK